MTYSRPTNKLQVVYLFFFAQLFVCDLQTVHVSLLLQGDAG